MPVAGDQLVGREVVEQLVEQRQELRGLRAIGPRFVVMARQQQRDRHVADGVVHDRPVGAALLVRRADRPPWRRRDRATPRWRRCSSIVKVTRLSKRAVVRMWHA